MSPIISIDSLSKTYAGGFQTLMDASLEIHKGEIFALLGPNGAGKTTLINIVCGIRSDSVYANLRAWIDSNVDGDFEHHESMSLAEAGVLSIGLEYIESPRVDSYGNEFRYCGRGTNEVKSKTKKMWTADVFSL